MPPFLPAVINFQMQRPRAELFVAEVSAGQPLPPSLRPSRTPGAAAEPRGTRASPAGPARPLRSAPLYSALLCFTHPACARLGRAPPAAGCSGSEPGSAGTGGEGEERGAELQPRGHGAQRARGGAGQGRQCCPGSVPVCGSVPLPRLSLCLCLCVHARPARGRGVRPSPGPAAPAPLQSWRTATMGGSGIPSGCLPPFPARDSGGCCCCLPASKGGQASTWPNSHLRSVVRCHIPDPLSTLQGRSVIDL